MRTMDIRWLCKFLPFFLILIPLAMAQAEIPLIKFGHIAGVTNTQRIVMQEKTQMFPHLEKSYKIEWLQFKGSPLAISAAAAGEIELGEASWTSAILAQVKGIPIITVADVTSSIKGKSFSPRWCVLEDSGINTVHDLKGKKISVITYGGDYDVYIRTYLKKYGIDPTKDVKLLDISQPFSVTGLRSKTVDMVPLTTPQYFIEKDKGGIRALFTNNDIYPAIQVHIVFARKNFLQSGGEVVRAFLSDYAKAAKYCNDNPIEANQIMIKSKGLDPRYAEKVEDFYRDPNGVPNLQAMMNVVDAMYSEGVIKRKLSSEELADLRFLPKH